MYKCGSIVYLSGLEYSYHEVKTNLNLRVQHVLIDLF